MARLLVVGAGGYGRAVAEAAMAGSGHTLAGFVDDRWPDLPSIWGMPVVGRLADLAALRSRADAVALAIGDGRARQSAFELALAVGFELASIVHPRAVVSPSAVLGRGLTIMAGAIVGTEARVDDGALINAGAVVDHHAHIGAFAHLGVGSCMGGGAVLEPGARLPAGGSLAAGQRRRAADSLPLSTL